VRAKLYVIPGSHPCECAEAALRLKGIEYSRVDLVPVMHKFVVRARFRGTTVPAVEIDGERIVGSRTILRRLDELRPEPRLYPDDPDLRRRVEEAEAWGDTVFQPLSRRLAWALMSRDRRAMLSYSREANLHMPHWFLKAGTRPVAAIATHFNRAGDDNVRADLQAFPGHLDRIEQWMAEGVLGVGTPNAADLQIGSSIRLLGTFGDLRPLLAGRPCEQLARTGFAPPVGAVPAGTLPHDWVPDMG
jgi:glutathione S-transferase